MDEPTPTEIRIDQDPGQPVRLTVNGIDVDVPAGLDPADIGFAAVAEQAQSRGETVRATLLDGRDALEWRVLVRPDGAITDDPDAIETARPRRRLPLRRGLLVALGAVVVLTGVDYAVTRPTQHLPGSSTASPASVQALETPTPSLLPFSGSIPAAPIPTTAPAQLAPAAPAIPARPRLVPRPAHAAPAIARTPRASTPAPRPAAPAPAAAAVAPPTTASSAVPPGKVVADGSGRCLTAGLVVASCDQPSAEGWTYSAGQLRYGDRCLAYGNGLVLAACDSANSTGWTASAGATTNAGMCLEEIGARAALTQCGTGTALVLVNR